MWIKTILTQFKNKKLTVAAFVDDAPSVKADTYPEQPYWVSLRCVYGSTVLKDSVLLCSLESAQDFVSNFNSSMAISFLKRQYNRIVV